MVYSHKTQCLFSTKCAKETVKIQQVCHSNKEKEKQTLINTQTN